MSSILEFIMYLHAASMKISQILKIIGDLLDRSSDLNISELLPKLYILAKACQDDVLEEWILLETSGYTDTNPAMHAGVRVPDYRKVPGQYHSKDGQPLIIDDPDIFKVINHYHLRESVSELENIAANNDTVSFRNPFVMEKLKQIFGVEVDQFVFKALSVLPILQEVKNQSISKLFELREKVMQSAITTGIDPEIPQELSSLHPEVQRLAGRLYRDGHYRQAILDTYIGLVDHVKKRSGRKDLDNTPLMQAVFSLRNPILSVSDESDEQQGFMWLFSGAVMAIRNPKAHRIIEQTDPQRTVEWLSFASVLLRVLDETTVNNPLQ
jgi:uncharacterized protein (TIGR02391 family)